jgi:hypothetical protein
VTSRVSKTLKILLLLLTSVVILSSSALQCMGLHRRLTLEASEEYRKIIEGVLKENVHFQAVSVIATEGHRDAMLELMGVVARPSDLIELACATVDAALPIDILSSVVVCDERDSVAVKPQCSWLLRTTGRGIRQMKRSVDLPYPEKNVVLCVRWVYEERYGVTWVKSTVSIQNVKGRALISCGTHSMEYPFNCAWDNEGRLWMNASRARNVFWATSTGTWTQRVVDASLPFFDGNPGCVSKSDK